MSSRFLDALYYVLDGNFRANQKEKHNMDEDDVPLTGHAAYYADQESFRKYAETLDPSQKEVRAGFSDVMRGLIHNVLDLRLSPM